MYIILTLVLINDYFLYFLVLQNFKSLKVVLFPVGSIACIFWSTHADCGLHTFTFPHFSLPSHYLVHRFVSIGLLVADNKLINISSACS